MPLSPGRRVNGGLARRPAACYNLIEATPERVTVYRKYPFHDRETLLSFDPQTFEYRKDPDPLGETEHG